MCCSRGICPPGGSVPAGSPAESRNRSPPLVTTSPGMIASVSGIFSLTVEPSPGRLVMSTTPPIFSMLDFTTSMPTPRPETLVTVCAVEKPGWKIRFSASRSLSFSACSGRRRPFFDRLLLDPRHVDAGAVVADFDVDLPALVIGAQRQPSLARLAGVARAPRRFDAVVARVADQVHQRILDGFDDGPVQLRLGCRPSPGESACQATRPCRAPRAAACSRPFRWAACASS